jgi:aerobic-type carbon monoxide dehydrogenase small subunit (CoxS/CutS family)
MRGAFDRSEPVFELELTLNGAQARARVAPLARLLDVLREEFRLTAAKEGCGEGECGACTVLLDGAPVLACLLPACQAQGARVVTAEGAGFERLRAEFVRHGAAQCGICTPGMVVAARAFLEDCARRGASPSRSAAREALAGNLCRCTGYEKILDAVLAAAVHAATVHAATERAP